MPSKTQNLNQNSNQNKNQKQLPKKERLSLMIVKTLLAILLFTGMAVIVIGGGYIIVRYTLLETEEMSVTTSKLEYKQGEIIELTIRNSFNKKQVIYFSDPFVEKFNHLKLENNWEPVKQVWCPCQAHCYEEKVSNIIKANGQLKYQWNQTESYCTNNPAWYSRQEISNQVEPSRYRFRIEVDEIGIIYSNEFIIAKEDIDRRRVYKNEEYGFELKYPEDWYLRRNYHNTDVMFLNTYKEIVRGGLRPDDYWLSPYSKRNPKYIDNWVGIGINVYQKPVDFNWDSWMKNEFPVVEKYENLDYSNLNSDLNGIKVIKSIGGISNIFLDGENEIFNVRFFSAFPYDVDDDGLNYFEQVISTFKFIEKDQIADWQTYRNEEFGYEVEYPNEIIEEEDAVLFTGLIDKDTVVVKILVKRNKSSDDLVSNIEKDIIVQEAGAITSDEMVSFGNTLSRKIVYGLPTGTDRTIYYIERNQDTIEIIWGYYERENIENIEKILSSFKFIE